MAETTNAASAVNDAPTVETTATVSGQNASQQNASGHHALQQAAHDTAQQAAHDAQQQDAEGDDEGGIWDQERVNNLNRTIRAGRDAQVLNYLKSIGIQPVKDSSGRESVKQTILGMQQILAGANRAADTGQQDTESPVAQALKSEADRWQQEARRQTERAETAIREKEEFVLRGRIATALGADIVDGGMEIAINEFLKHHEFIQSDDAFFIKRNGEIVLGAKSKPATLEEAARRFLDSTPFLRRPTVQAGGRANGTAVPGVRTASYQDLQAGRVSIADVAAGRVRLQ